MTSHKFALSVRAARLLGTDASLSTALRGILAVALQELIEAELTATIGAAPGERTTDRVTQRNGHRPQLISTPGGDVELGIPLLRQGSFIGAGSRAPPACSSTPARRGRTRGSFNGGVRDELLNDWQVRLNMTRFLGHLITRDSRVEGSRHGSSKQVPRQVPA